MSLWIVWEKSTKSEQFGLGSQHCHLLALWPWASYLTSLYSALSSQKWNFLISTKSTYLRRMVGGTKEMIREMTKVSLHIRSPWVQGKEVGDRAVGITVRKQEALQLLPSLCLCFPDQPWGRMVGGPRRVCKAPDFVFWAPIPFHILLDWQKYAELTFWIMLCSLQSTLTHIISLNNYSKL